MDAYKSKTRLLRATKSKDGQSENALPVGPNDSWLGSPEIRQLGLVELIVVRLPTRFSLRKQAISFEHSLICRKKNLTDLTGFFGPASKKFVAQRQNYGDV